MGVRGHLHNVAEGSQQTLQETSELALAIGSHFSVQEQDFAHLSPALWGFQEDAGSGRKPTP